VFAGLTVEENLAVVRSRTHDAYRWFPELIKRRNVFASNLSGGAADAFLGPGASLRPLFQSVSFVTEEILMKDYDVFDAGGGISQSSEGTIVANGANNYQVRG
jgi:hypothetical protein